MKQNKTRDMKKLAKAQKNWGSTLLVIGEIQIKATLPTKMSKI